MTQVTAAELKVLDLREFEREYSKWQENAGDYFAEGIQKGFTEDMEPFGVRVDSIAYSGFYCQGSYAAFTGRVDIATWMRTVDGMSSEYPALYLGVTNDGSYAKVTTSPRGHIRIDMEFWASDSEPSGVFSGLDQETWGALVTEQENALGLEDALDTWCTDRGSELYSTLEEAYEYAISEEQFIESCDCNEVTFEINTEED